MLLAMLRNSRSMVAFSERLSKLIFKEKMITVPRIDNEIFVG